MKEDDYEKLDCQALRDLCGAREIRYPSKADKPTLIDVLVDADFDEI